MQKLLYITPHLSTGGAPQYLLKKIELLKNDYDISLVEYTDVGGTEFVVQKNKIFDLIPSTNRITLGEDKTQLLDFLDQIQPDIVHLEEIPELFMDREVAEILYDKGRSYLIFETSHDSSQNPEYKQFFPDKFMFVSNWQIEQYKDINIPAVLVEYPIEYKETRNRTAACQRLGLDPNKKHIIHIGLFTPRKNQAEFFEYARALPEYEFHCVGNQAVNFQHYWEPLMQNKPSNLTWWGERNDVNNFYEAAVLFLFTSKGNPYDKETMPLVIREALSWRLPIFIYNLEVYQNYFDNYQVQYLNENKEQNIKNIKNMIEGFEIISSSVTAEDFDVVFEGENKINFNYKKADQFDCKIVVKEKYRGNNISQTILDLLQEYAIKQNCYKVILDCKRNIKKVYEKNNFVDIT
jgi:glycosyltransferase involved in cell wall biosynthesis